MLVYDKIKKFEYEEEKYFLIVVIVLEFVEVQVDLTVLVLNHVDQEVLLFLVLELFDLVVN